MNKTNNFYVYSIFITENPEKSFFTRGSSFDVPAMSKELSWLKSGKGCDWVLVLEGKD